MAAEQSRELESGCDILPQMSSCDLHCRTTPFAFSTSKAGDLPVFHGKSFMWPNSSNFAPLQVWFFRMSSYSAVNCQWDESLSRLCMLDPQPHTAKRPERRKAWASGETKPTLRKCGKGTCRSKKHLSFSPASPTPLLPASM